MAASTQSDPTSVLGRRVLATLLDAAIVLIPAIMFVTTSLEYLPEDRLGGRTGAAFCDDFLDSSGGFCFDMSDIDERVYFADSLNPGGTAWYWLVSFAMLVLLQGLTGWTIGKLITGIRTVGEDGRPPGIGKALLRWVLWVLDGFPYVLPLVGGITALTTVGHRRVGDMAAKTFVVRASAAGSPIVVPGLTAPPPPPGYAAGVPWGTTAAPPGQGWGDQSQQASQSWSPPQPGTWSTPPAEAPGDQPTPAEPWGGAAPGAAPVETTPSAPAPQWDEARGTYIQWDPSQGAWLQWDDISKAWIRIPGQ